MFKNIYYWFAYRFIPKHRYNILRTGLKPGYYDPSEQILYAVFNSFAEWYETSHHLMARDEEEIREMLTPVFKGDLIGKDYYETNKKTFEELKSLYVWWTEIVKRDPMKWIEEQVFHKDKDPVSNFRFDSELEEKLEEECTDKLKLLVSHRKSMWY